jgi:hypothetical protein
MLGEQERRHGKIRLVFPPFELGHALHSSLGAAQETVLGDTIENACFLAEQLPGGFYVEFLNKKIGVKQPVACLVRQSRANPELAHHVILLRELAVDDDALESLPRELGASHDVLWQATYFKNATVPGVYVFNFGIVDCTPRVLHRGEAWLLRKLGMRLPTAVAQWLRQHRVVRKVSPEVFRQNCRAIKALSLGELLVLPIAPASDGFESVAPGIQASIVLYNAILAEEFGDAFCAVELDWRTHIMSDHHHLTVQGHFQVFDFVRQRLELLIHKQGLRQYG